MKLFFAFLVLCLLGGLIVPPARSDVPVRLYLAVLCVALVTGYFVLHKL